MGLYQDFNAIVVGDIRMELVLYSTRFFSHLVTDQSFGHNLNQASSQNTYLTKVVILEWDWNWNEIGV